MPDPDPKATVPSVPSDEELTRLSWSTGRTPADLLETLRQVRDRTREATMKKMGALLGAAGEFRNVPR